MMSVYLVVHFFLTITKGNARFCADFTKSLLCMCDDNRLTVWLHGVQAYHVFIF